MLTTTVLASIGGGILMANTSSAQASHSEKPRQERDRGVDPSIYESPRTTNPTAPVSPNITALIGNYENHLYDGTSEKNDWHYVTITRIDDQTLLWSNRAGVSWQLKLTDNRNFLLVGDNPYSGHGHTESMVVWEGEQVKGLTGPWNELYERSR